MTNLPPLPPVYLTGDEVLDAASWLVSEDNSNSEYDRAITEFAVDLLGISTAYYEVVSAEIRRKADAR